jgi:hypothetical protein
MRALLPSEISQDNLFSLAPDAYKRHVTPTKRGRDVERSRIGILSGSFLVRIAGC